MRRRTKPGVPVDRERAAEVLRIVRASPGLHVQEIRHLASIRQIRDALRCLTSLLEDGLVVALLESPFPSKHEKFERSWWPT